MGEVSLALLSVGEVSLALLSVGRADCVCSAECVVSNNPASAAACRCFNSSAEMLRRNEKGPLLGSESIRSEDVVNFRTSFTAFSETLIHAFSAFDAKLYAKYAGAKSQLLDGRSGSSFSSLTPHVGREVSSPIRVSPHDSHQLASAPVLSSSSFANVI